MLRRRQDEHTSAVSPRGSPDLPRPLHSAAGGADARYSPHPMYPVSSLQRLLPASVKFQFAVTESPSVTRPFIRGRLLLPPVVCICRCICVTSPTDDEYAIRDVRCAGHCQRQWNRGQIIGQETRPQASRKGHWVFCV